MIYREELSNDRVRLTADNGIMDIRTRQVHSEVICKAKHEKYFIEAE